MPIIAHIGIDGSGKTYGMAQDCARRNIENLKKKNDRQTWYLGGNMEGAGKLEHPHQILYLENSDIFLDELQRYYPATNSQIDEITHHIISTHRHQKNTIHWASQDWRYVHYFWRYETSHAWIYKALFRDPETGHSKIKRHRRILVPGADLELRRRQFRVEKKQSFWIKKKGTALYNSYEKIDVAMRDVTPEYVASIKDPRSSFILPSVDDMEEPQNDENNLDRDDDALNPEHRREHDQNERDGKNDTEHFERCIDQINPCDRP